MIKVIKLGFKYPDNPVLKDITLSFNEGEFTTILGPNGAGKSTFIRIIAGLLAGYQGQVEYNSQDIKEIKRKELAKIAAYIPQDIHLSFPFTVEQIVMMGRHPYSNAWQSSSQDDIAAVTGSIKTVGCEHLRDRIFYELSGGEKQLVLIASALAQHPSVLLLDEPAAALDIHHQIRIYHILRRLAKEKKLTIIVITHQINQALNNADRILLLNKGKIAMDAAPDQVIRAEALAEVFNVKGEKIFQEKNKKWYFFAQEINYKNN